MLGQRRDGRLFVREAPAGLGAQAAGLRPGDEILLVDGADVRTMSVAELDRALGGDVGQPVKLTVLRNDTVIRVVVRRTPAERRAPTPR